MLDDSRLEEDVELEICDEGILIRPAKNPRENWDSAFKEMAEEDADELEISDQDAPTEFEKGSWRW